MLETVKSTCCSSRGPKLSSGDSQQNVATAPQFPHLLMTSWGTCIHVHILTMQTQRHTQIKKEHWQFNLSTPLYLPSFPHPSLCLAAPHLEALLCTPATSTFSASALSENTLLLILRLSLCYFLPTSRIRVCVDESL